jgi:arginase family enzyme
VLLPGELAVFMPEPGGPTLVEAEELLRDIAARCRIAGLGLTGLHESADPDALVRLAAAAGL